MNVWVIGRGYPTKYNKVQGSFELEQAEMLKKAGCKVTYIALIFHPFRKVKKWGYCTWNENGITIFTYSQVYAPERFFLHIKKFQEKKWRDLLEKVEEQCGRPDVIHVHYPSMITEPDEILKYKKKGTKIVVTEHWTKVLTGQLKKHQIEHLTEYANRADAFICVGSPLRDSVKRISGTEREIYVVPNVVSEKFRYMEPQKRNYFEYVAVGRLVPVKQFDKIIEAYAATFGKGQEDVRLAIIGAGPETKKLENLINKYNIQNSVTLTGALSRDDTAKRVREADALICYSRLETFGVPVIEAWACGKPVITSDALGFLEYWNDSLGYIVPCDDIEILKEAIIKLYLEKEKYCGKMIAEFANSNFSETIICKRLLDIYKNNK